MLAQRTLQQSLRRSVQQGRFAAPAAIATGRVFTTATTRYAAATSVSDTTAANEILAKQRLNRPVSPHLGIYQPQITWYGSIANRITGCILSGVFYVYGAAYLVAPTMGWHLESASMAAAFAAWPVALKVLTKMSLALPFTYHCMNGIRHLVWDTASMITNPQVNATGWTVVGLSVVGALGLALM